MRTFIGVAGATALLLGTVGADGQNPGQDSAAAAFSGRWQVNMESIQARQFPFAIVEIDAGGAAPSAKIIRTLPTKGRAITIESISIRNGRIALLFNIEDPQLLMHQFQVGKIAAFRGWCAGDHLQGTVDTGAVNAWWYAFRTTQEQLVPWTAHEDEEAFRSACERPAAERMRVLRQVLKDYPDAHMRNHGHPFGR